jgi:hypothetical protein
VVKNVGVRKSEIETKQLIALIQTLSVDLRNSENKENSVSRFELI